MSQTSRVLRLSFKGDRNVELRLDSLDLFLDGRRVKLPNVRVREVIVQVARYWPNVGSYAQLSGTRDLPLPRLSRLVFEANKALEQAGMAGKLIHAHRNEGYALVDGWTVVNEAVNGRQIADQLIGQLGTAIAVAREHVQRAQLESNAAGLMYVVRTQTARNIAAQNYILIEDTAWNLLSLLSDTRAHPAKKGRLIELKRAIETLESYAFMWRVGDGDEMTARQWRSDFEQESEALLAQIERMVDDILESRSDVAKVV